MDSSARRAWRAGGQPEFTVAGVAVAKDLREETAHAVDPHAAHRARVRPRDSSAQRTRVFSGQAASVERPNVDELGSIRVAFSHSLEGAAANELDRRVGGSPEE